MKTFDRDLFKEAYKAGYKKAKLNEAVEDGAADYKDFFKKLARLKDDIKMEAYLYDKNGDYKAEFNAKFDPYGYDTLYLLSKKTGAKKRQIGGYDIVSIDPKGPFMITLKNGNQIGLWVWKQVDAMDMGII